MSINARTPWVNIAILTCLWALGAACMLEAHAADKPAVENPEVAKALTEAQKLADKKQWAAALAAVKRAEQVPDKSAYADYKIDEFMAFVLTRQRKYGDAAAVFERLAASDQSSAAQAATHLKTAAQLYMQANQNGKAAAAAKQALQRRPGDAQLLELAGQAQFLANDFKGAAATMQQLVRTTQKQGEKPEETWLQVILNAYYKLDDQERIAETWETLLRYYPKSQYWETVLDLKTAGEQPEAVEVGYQRLMFERGILKDERDYEDLAMSTIDNGAPGEAVRVLQRGLEMGKLSGESQARFQRMLTYAQEAAARNREQMDKLKQQAESARSGQPSVALGRAYLAQGRHDDAIAAFRQGLAKGALEDENQARVDLGIAYLRKDQIKQARQTFAAVERDSQWRDLAELWSLHAMTANAQQ